MLSPVIGDAYFLPVGVVFILTLLAAAAFGVWTLFVLSSFVTAPALLPALSVVFSFNVLFVLTSVLLFVLFVLLFVLFVLLFVLFVLLFVLSESGAALSFDGFSVMSDFSYVSVYVIAYVENLSVSNDIVCALPSYVDSSISLYS